MEDFILFYLEHQRSYLDLLRVTFVRFRRKVLLRIWQTFYKVIFPISWDVNL